MSGFDASWLRQREPFDTAARSAELARRFAQSVSAGGARPTRIVDLAAGTGASLRALAPLIGGEQEWLLVDNDKRLLDTSLRWNDGSPWRVRTQTLDLAHQLEKIDLADYDGVTTTAFLDLVSTSWLDRLSELLARRRTPFLAALTVDGRRDWHPPLAADARIAETFRRHQTTDKGFGPAAGARAAGYLEKQLTACGYEVHMAQSDWQITDRDMLLHLIDESGAIADDAEWSAKRHAQLEAGALSVTIGHLDLLAI